MATEAEVQQAIQALANIITDKTVQITDRINKLKTINKGLLAYHEELRKKTGRKATPIKNAVKDFKDNIDDIDILLGNIPLRDNFKRLIGVSSILHAVWQEYKYEALRVTWDSLFGGVFALRKTPKIPFLWKKHTKQRIQAITGKVPVMPRFRRAKTDDQLLEEISAYVINEVQQIKSVLDNINKRQQEITKQMKGFERSL